MVSEGIVSAKEGTFVSSDITSAFNVYLNLPAAAPKSQLEHPFIASLHVRGVEQAVSGIGGSSAGVLVPGDAQRNQAQPSISM